VNYDYTILLLKDRRRELRALELKYQTKLIGTADYLSCRCSLLQAIGQLETLSPDDQQEKNVLLHLLL
jgi:hypothetical protein